VGPCMPTRATTVDSAACTRWLELATCRRRRSGCAWMLREHLHDVRMPRRRHHRASLHALKRPRASAMLRHTRSHDCNIQASRDYPKGLFARMLAQVARLTVDAHRRIP
jgi:hypothetical protein